MNNKKNIVLLTNKIEPETYETFTKSRDLFLLVLFQSPIFLSYDGITYFKVPANSLILFKPTSIQAYKSAGGLVLNSFIYLDYEESYFQNLNIPTDVLVILKKEHIEELVFKLDRLSYIVNTPYAKSLEDKIPEYVDKFFTTLSKFVNETSINVGGSTLLSSLLYVRGLMFKDPVKYTVRQMAYEIGFTETYFGIKYKQAFGITPNQDRKIKMVEKIKKLLLETDYSLDTIAEICGIKSTAHLINTFKSVEKVTPYHYKKERK